MTRSTAFRAALDASRARGLRVGLVPTMGSLHAGHASLDRTSGQASNDAVAMTIFVNPLQFGAGEDFDAYPRDLDRDLRLAERRRRYPRVRPVGRGDVPRTGLDHGPVAGVARVARGRRAGRPISPASPRWWPSCSPSPARAGPTSARRTSSSSRSCGAWPPTCLSRSRSSAARPCASPTDWPSRAATCTSRPSSGPPPRCCTGRCGPGPSSCRRRTGRGRRASRVAELVHAEPLIDLDYADVVDAATLERHRSARGRRAAARGCPLGPDPIDRQRRCRWQDEQRGQDPACAATPGDEP